MRRLLIALAAALALSGCMSSGAIPWRHGFSKPGMTPASLDADLRDAEHRALMAEGGIVQSGPSQRVSVVVNAMKRRGYELTPPESVPDWARYPKKP